MKNLITIIALFFFAGCTAPDKQKEEFDGYPISGVPFNKVQVTDNFWLPKIETNRKVTIPASFRKCEEMGRLENFLIAGGRMEGEVRGDMPFDDTDVYKIIEGASYSMATIPDKEMDVYVDSLIEIISIGQEEDGYLTTWKTIDPNNSPAEWCPPGDQWENLAWSHELYNAGHMYEAAAAHYISTGKTSFLDIATKNADLLLTVFGPDKNTQVPGHQIVETGLVKLFLITQKKEYLNLARHFLDGRGDSTKREIWGPYSQDHKPVTEQDEAVGHAVRAAYMYAGMTDIAALDKDTAYREAVDNIWENVVTKKMYITGGIGARHAGEAFGDNYELPNLTAYNETCAAIANVYWNYRMFLLHGDSKFIDVLERSLYNGVISGVALDGKNFFYPNPLSCDLHYHFNRNHMTRQPWFDCSCCPSNMCRFMPSVPGYIYAQKDNDLYINLFVQSNTKVYLQGKAVGIEQKTRYPWNGDVEILVNPQERSEFTVRVRIPGWAFNRPLPGDLYAYEGKKEEDAEIFINGKKAKYGIEKGYAVLTREWEKGDEIRLSMPMEIRKVRASDLVEEDRGKVALERGPIVYCVEEVDNPEFDSLSITDNMKFSSSFKADFLAGLEVIKASGGKNVKSFTAIPYYAWNNRGSGKMDVWLPEI